MISKQIASTSFVLLLNLVFTATVFGQSLTGVVLDENKTPIEYAHVGIVGKYTGTISGLDGTFRLPISGITANDSLSVSSIGFEIQSFLLSHFSSSENIVIILKSKIYTVASGEVKATKPKPISFGRSKANGNSGFQFSGIMSGSEVGMTFKNNQHITLSHFSFHVRAEDFDSLLYRINVYETNGNKITLLNKKEILNTSLGKEGWVFQDFASLTLTTNSDFAIGVEVIKGWINGQAISRGTIIFSGRAALRKDVFTRDHRFSPIEYLANKFSFSVHGYQD
jgi:hypothetical protein